MKPKEANDIVVQAVKDALAASDEFMQASMKRDETLAFLKQARENLEDVLREATGLDERADRKEEYLRLYCFKADR